MRNMTLIVMVYIFHELVIEIWWAQVGIWAHNASVVDLDLDLDLEGQPISDFTSSRVMGWAHLISTRVAHQHVCPLILP